MTLLQTAYPSFDLHGIQVLAITPASMDIANDYVPRFHILFPVVCDPEFDLFTLYGVDKGGAAGALKMLRPDRLVANLRALRHGVRSVEGIETQLPAFFVVAPGGRLAYAQYGKSISDLPDVDALLEAARGCS
jgi:peroxiredoxin